MLANTFDFTLPDHLNAAAPPEKRGIRRDYVRLMVLDKNTYERTDDYFYRLDRYILPGDVLVFNNSRTIPAVLTARQFRNGKMINACCEVRLAAKRTEDAWDALIPSWDAKAGDLFDFGGDLEGFVIGEGATEPLKRIHFSKGGAELMAAIVSRGEPIRYEYIREKWPLEYYQTVFATHPGSVEMPSAGRPFSWELLWKLEEKGIQLAFLQLHTGLSYFLDDRWDHSPDQQAERYAIPLKTMEIVNRAKQSNNRVIAVGTTVVRALETAATTGNLSGWTNLYINQSFRLNVTDGILTGFHEPKASHLELLSAFLPEAVLMDAYNGAIEREYLFHEFGDMNLII